MLEKIITKARKELIITISVIKQVMQTKDKKQLRYLYMMSNIVFALLLTTCSGSNELIDENYRTNI